MQHLSVRVAWHDNGWNGTVCAKPSGNPYCLDLERIRSDRDDESEDRHAGQAFAALTPDRLPPCAAESAAFMNPATWFRRFEHPYAGIPKARETHGHLRPTTVKVPPYSTFAVPYAWMLRANSDAIAQRLPDQLTPDDEPPFPSPWVFRADRQRQLTDAMFGQVAPGRSLVLFYTKSGHPLGDHINRLLIGVGRITDLGKVLEYDVASGEPTFPMWDRLFGHSIRPDGSDGLLLPYQEYLRPTGDPHADIHHRELLAQIAVMPDPGQIMAFSYGSETVSSDVALTLLERTLAAVRAVKEHGIAPGPWTDREQWLNDRIADTWADRGAFPGAAAVLEALGLRLATAMLLELARAGRLRPAADPWPLLDSLIRGTEPPPRPAYAADIAAFARTWTALPEPRRDFVRLLSRFAIDADAARRWLEPGKRADSTLRAVTDLDILANPYLIPTLDLGGNDGIGVSLRVVDRGLLPEAQIAVAAPLPEPSLVASPADPRRIEAALVSVLRAAAEDGDALLAVDDAIEAVRGLKLTPELRVSSDWIAGHVGDDHPMLRSVAAPPVTGAPADPAPGGPVCLQLTDLAVRGRKLARTLDARAGAPLASLHEDWRNLLVEAIGRGGGSVDESNQKHATALNEQADALERITNRKLSVLVGRAGTGKTSVIGALLASPKLHPDGLLLLAPTGKATVQLRRRAPGAMAQNIAQFLYGLKRYDGLRQRVRFDGDSPYRGARTIVIDECSMLTEDQLAAVLNALDSAYVQRIILVGDPYQLPPIGVGRPFADLVAHLEHSGSEALARLTVELRTQTGDQPSDALRFASLFTTGSSTVDADSVLSELAANAGEGGTGAGGAGGSGSDLRLVFWETAEELHTALLTELALALRMKHPDDMAGYAAALHFNDKGFVSFEDHSGANRFQVLSPVRMRDWGTYELNRFLQRHFNAVELGRARRPFGLSYGREEIVPGDKVMLLTNKRRKVYNTKTRQTVEDYFANGEIGLAAYINRPYLNVAFADREPLSAGFYLASSTAERVDLELAYALTVHKAQGSEFETVLAIVPAEGRLLSRELLYTAVTRARTKLVLLVQGTDAGPLFELSRPEQSETARRNTNLFAAGIRRPGAKVPYAAHLIHRTVAGELVRSKSEVIIANLLHKAGVAYEYERPLEGSIEPGTIRPDFTMIDYAGEPIVWEHLGMLDRPDYRQAWERRLAWYQRNGFILGTNLFTSEETGAGLDSTVLDKQVNQIKELVS